MNPSLPRRPYGKSGDRVSVVAFGGLALMATEPAHACHTVAAAIERGVNYFDVAPTYGNAQERLGPALEPFRKDCFLACKTIVRDAAGVRAELARSREQLRTDHLDLYQMHALDDSAKDLDAAFAPGGAIEAFVEARKAGFVRHIGFSSHNEATALAAMDRFDFDSVMFPISFGPMLRTGYGRAVLAKAASKGATVVAIKALARQPWPKDCPDRPKNGKCWYQPLTNRPQADLALRFTLNQSVASAISSGEEEMLWLALDIAQDLRPLSDDEMATLRELAEQVQPIFPK
jgi:aryl-alcohol dehydrogenase-like predicted oxidoreductase